jgi:hypothetical protein
LIRSALPALALTLAACGQSAEQQRKDDDRDVAAVEAAQNRLPPTEAVALQFLLPADQARMDGVGGRCIYSNGETSRTDPVLVTMGSFGWIKVKGELIKLAADSSSDPGPVRTWTRYTGRENTLRILPAESRVAPSDSARTRQQVRLVVRDAWDREVSAATLLQDCRP